MNDHTTKSSLSVEELTDGEIPVLVDFYATWCGPCKMMAPVLVELKKRFGEKLRIVKIDIDAPANAVAVNRYNVRSVPTLMLFRQKELLWRESGAHDVAHMEQIINRFL